MSTWKEDYLSQLRWTPTKIILKEKVKATYISLTTQKFPKEGESYIHIHIYNLSGVWKLQLGAPF